MEQTKNIVEQLLVLSKARSKADKQDVIKRNINTPGFTEVLVFILNPYDVIGLSTKKIQKDITPQNILKGKSVVDVIDYLRRNPTGTNEVIANVRGFLSEYDDAMSGYLEDILTKTFTMGVSSKSVNKAYGETIIPIFDIQLAYAYEKKITKYNDDDRFYVTQKVDGHRAIMTVGPGEGGISIVTYTRSGKVYDKLNELEQHMLTFISQNRDVFSQFPDGFVLDGELLKLVDENISTVDLFQETAKILSSNTEKTNIKYHIFDILPLPEFLNMKTSKMDYEFRRSEWLDNLNDTALVNILPVLSVINKDEIMMWSDYATTQGWEGVMLNASNGLYRKTRSSELLKVKKMHTADLEIIGFKEATSGELKGNMASIIVRLDDDNQVQVSSGLTLELRTEIWENQENYIGKMIEVQYFEESTNATGGRSLRHPVFKTLRLDKTPEDANIE